MPRNIKDYDFSGWATRNNIKCKDGRTIRRNAFAGDDGITVPLVYMHNHSDVTDVLGHALLENRPEGVYMYGKFNDTYEGQHAKASVQNGDITSLSIHAGELKHANGRDVVHGAIREVSLVIAPANPGARIDYVSMEHGSDGESDEAWIYSGYQQLNFNAGDGLFLPEELEHSAGAETKKEEPKVAENTKPKKTEEDDNDFSILDTLTDEQRAAYHKALRYAVDNAEDIRKALSEDEEDAAEGGEEQGDEGGEVSHSDDPYDEGGYDNMNYNVFDTPESAPFTLTHADQEMILDAAKNRGITFQAALGDYFDSYAKATGQTLSHGIDEIETLFPEYHDVYTGEPETFKRDLSWVSSVINGVHKSPFARVRTRFADARAKELRAKGYIKGDKKTVSGNIKLLKRTTDPQMIYRKDALEREDIIGITDFDVVDYQWKIMRENLNEDIALAILVGDDRDDDDREQIKPEHVRPIWKDEELFTLHADIDFDAMKQTLQGTETAQHFSDNYVYAEAMVETLLYTREKYKGSGNLAMYCTPHLVNQMLLSRDLNGRRIYQNENDLRAALNVSAIHTVEQLEGRVRTTEDNHKKKLVALLVNLNDYQVGSVKGGEITKFSQFDIDFNQEKMLLETQMSGALIKPWSAIAIEEDVTGQGQ